VYCETMGVNLFMVRVDVWGNRPRPSPSLIYKPPAYGPHGNGHRDDTQSRPFLRSAHYLVVGAVRAYTRFGQISYLANDEFIGATFARGGYWEESEVRRVAELLGGVAAFAVDVGAHVGSHSLALAALCPGLSFICFEPQLPLRLLLERNIAENGLGERFVVSPKAVAHCEMKASLAGSFSDGSAADQPISYGGQKPANYGGVQLGEGGETVETISLDCLAATPIAYIKLDVEGAECLAVAGARQVLESQRPLMLFEHREDRRLPDEVLDRLGVSKELRELDISAYLRGLGYRLAALGQDVIAVPSDAPPIASDSKQNGAIPPTGSSPAEPAARGPLFGSSAPLLPTVSCIAAVPPVLFQTWKTHDNLPPAFTRCRQSFLDACKGYATPLWDDNDNRRFVKHHFDWFTPVYEAYPKEIYRADAVRYFFLYAFGGIYADLDVYCLKSLDSIVGQKAVVLGRMGADPDFEHSVPNAVMASCPRHPFWLLVIAKMIEAQAKYPAGRPEYLTGPIVLKSALDQYANQSESAFELIGSVARHLPTHQQPAATETIFTLCANDWFPFNWADPIHQIYRQALRSQEVVPDVELCRNLFPSSTLVTFWSHSWEPEPQSDIRCA
jgi:FkbM family methyltransferase